MVEYWSSISKGSLRTKLQMKFPVLQRTIILTLVMISSFYICLFYLNQRRFISPNWTTIEVVEEAYEYPNIPTVELPHLHYPKPTTYISSNGEIFFVKERRRNASTIKETLDKVYNLDWSSSASKNECTGAVGFKWMLNQGLMQNQEDIVEYFKRKGVSSIFLFRRNLLRRLVSLLANAHDRNAKQLNGTHKAHVHSRLEAEVLARFKPLIDVERLIPEMKQTSKWSTDVLHNFKGTRHIVLYYEDLVRNKAKMMDVLDFLRIPHAKLTSRHVKIHTRPLSDHIENWDAVSQALKGTDYESFLHSDYQRK